MSILLKDVVLDGATVSIRLDKDGISAVAPELQPLPDEEVFSGESRFAVLPPFYNTHTHAAMTLLRGFAEDMELFDWLSNHIWPAEALLTEEDVYAGSKLAVTEMIRSGTVWFNDAYWHPEATLRAVKESGMRAHLGMLYLDGVVNDPETANEKLLAAAQGAELVKVSHMPHAIYTVNTPTLQKIAAVMERDGRQLHIHVAETAKEVEDCLKAHGKTPVEYLDSLGLISDRAMLAHCVHLTDHDREIIAKRGAYIAHNPVSNLKLCSGMFDFEAAKAAGCKITIGTDGCSSNNNLSMLDEMKCAALTAKTVSGVPTAGKTADIFRAASATGAEYAGVNIGKIAPGRAADLLLIDLHKPVLSAGHDLTADMVYAAGSDVIDSVICAGKFLMKHGFIPGEAEAADAVREVGKRLRRQLNIGKF